MCGLNYITVIATDKDNHLLEITPEIDPARYGIVNQFSVYRYDRGDDRYYYTNPDNKGATGYLSVTSFTKKSLPTSPYLIDWMVGMGSEGAEFYKKERAGYGTFLHCEIVHCLNNNGGNFQEISKRAFDTAREDGYGYNALKWASDIANDIASFFHFLKEKDVKVIAAEFPVVSEKYRLAGCIDFVLRFVFNRKEINCLLDVKSGRKGFFEAHELQLHTYKTIWNENFGEVFPVTHVFNWGPKNINAKTKYGLKNQTGSIFADSVERRMAMAKLEGWVKPPVQHLEIKGDFTVNNFNLSEHMFFESI